MSKRPPGPPAAPHGRAGSRSLRCADDTAARRPTDRPVVQRLVAAVALGLALGAATSAAQALLGGSAFAGLANAVSPWVVASFLVGATGGGRGSAAALGIAACVPEVAGYYLTAALRGFGIAPAYVLLWAAAALVAGVVFGIAGHSWRRAAGRERGLGAALLVAVWTCEAVVSYGVVLGYLDDAAVFGGIAVLLFALLGRRGRQHTAVLAWLAPALVLGGGGMLALHDLL